jgi:hypothetical protein
MDEKHFFDEDLENIITRQCNDEYTLAKRNQQAAMSDFEANLDIVECKRTEKAYDWMSDVFIPEAPSIFLTEASHEAAQYFATRDFVDIYLEDGKDPKQVLSCTVAKKVINASLNNRNIHHYMKYMQAREINRLAGYVYALCWWEQETKQVQKGTQRWLEADMDEQGNMMMNEMGQPSYSPRERPVMDEIVLRDQFNWMPLDPRNVFPIDNRYTYSAQEETGILVRSEKTYWELKKDEKKNNYINLDILKEWDSAAETETSAESYNKGENTTKVKTTHGSFDVIERFGSAWAKVTTRDKFGFATEAIPGLVDGEPTEDAEFILMRITYIYKGSQKLLIRYQPEPLRDGTGMPYMPIVRGINYPHAVKKNGMSDAKYLRELQVAMNDTINASNDRVMLSTFPTFIGSSLEDGNDSIFFEPEHLIQLRDPSPDNFREIKISSDTSGAINQFGLFRAAGQQVASVYPNTMGDPGTADITATAIAGADSRANVRNNYKSLTAENTFLNDFYWMILNMTWQFMHPKTAMSLMTRDELLAFNPVGDYTFQPVTSNIELEHNKYKKIQNYDQMVGRLQGLAQGNPAIIPIIGYIVGRQLELMGSEYRAIQPMIENLQKTPMRPEPGRQGPGGPPEQMSNLPQPMTSNQNGVEVQPTEEIARAGMQ